MSFRRGLYLPLALAVFGVTNALVLAGVYANRQVPADSVIELSERELGVSFGRHGFEANGTVTLRLNYRWPGAGGDDGFIKAAKMLELGFDINPEPVNCQAGRTQKRPARDAFLVLEANGPAYQGELEAARKAHVQATQWLKAKPGDKSRQNALEAAQSTFDYERYQASRLLVVDAGLDREALRARYLDRKRYAVVAASVQPRTKTLDVAEGISWLCVPYATASVAVPRIHVPREFYAEFVSETLPRQYGRYAQSIDAKPFTAELAFGRRLEPWLLSAQSIQP